jgi:TonB family protein
MKASVIVLVALAATTLMRKRSAAVRHWVLSAAIVCAAATPLLELVVPSWHLALGATAPVRERDAAVPRAAASSQTAAPVSLAAVSPEPPRPNRDALSYAVAMPSLTTLLTAAWIAGVSISIGLLLVGLGRLAWLASRSRRLVTGPWIETAEEISRRYGIARPVWLLQSDHPSLLVTWGLLRPRIILPRAACAWPADRIRIVLSHELAHIQRGDWLVQMTAELLRSVYWFNPLLWIAGRRLRQESEHACDDAVLNLGVDGSEYAGHLLDLARDAVRDRARWSPNLPAAAIARPSNLERRVTAMLNARLNRTPLSRSARVMALIAILAVAIPIAGFGQTSFVSFSGSVVDPTGRIIPGVTLVLSDMLRDAKREVRTDSGGRFEFVGVPAGEYALDISFMGFMPVRENVTLAAPYVQKNYSLEVGMVQETITLVGGGDPPNSNRPSMRSNTGYQPAQAAYDPCSASPVGGCLRPPTKIRDFRPEYPQHLSDRKVAGVVLLIGRIGADGSMVRVQLADPADPIDPAFAQSAIAAVSQWQFTPTQLGGVPIETNMKITVNFVIRQ